MKILVIQQKMIGDVLTSSILFEILREKYPNAQLDYLINSNTLPVIKGNPYIDNLVLFTKKEQSSKRALFKLGKEVKQEQYDILIDVYSKLSSNIISILSSAKTKISYYKYYSTWIYNHNVKRKTNTSLKAGLAIVNRLQLLEPLGILSDSIQPKIYLSPKEVSESRNMLQRLGIDFKKPLFMISVLGSGNNKTYPFHYMAQVIDYLVSKTNGQIVFNYIPDQLNDAKAIMNLCSEETKRNIHFDISGKGLREFLAITYHCDALIGNEGGAINMAKALNVPTFAIFSPWIDKATWSIFEDDSKNTSVHLKDFRPELYDKKIEKDMKSKAMMLYKEFKPEFFLDKLNSFLNQLNG